MRTKRSIRNWESVHNFSKRVGGLKKEDDRKETSRLSPLAGKKKDSRQVIRDGRKLSFLSREGPHRGRGATTRSIRGN